MKATYVDHMGTDLSVVNAARVSFGKKSEWDQHMEDHVSFRKCVNTLSNRDTKLIKYLAEHDHWSPFSHTAITVHVKAPIFVARQLGKHQVGFTWNEVSRRYVTDLPEFYTPEIWRNKAEDVKQGSAEDGITESIVGSKDHNQFALDYYKDLLDSGVCPEQARMVLPQSMYTEWYWTGNLYAFANMYKLRTDSHTQKETREVAAQIGQIIQPLFPVSWEVLTQ